MGTGYRAEWKIKVSDLIQNVNLWRIVHFSGFHAALLSLGMISDFKCAGTLKLVSF